MLTNLAPHEAHLRDVARRFTAIRRLETEAYALLEEDPFQPEIAALLDLIAEHKHTALCRLRQARRQLRLACPACLQAVEHDLDALGCAAHLEGLVVGV